jgi:hypothetical protein
MDSAVIIYTTMDSAVLIHTCHVLSLPNQALARIALLLKCE